MSKKIDTLSLKEATEVLRQAGLRTTETTIRDGLEQGVYPFGDCVKRGKNRVFHIYRRLLEQWIDERAMEA